MLDPQLRAHSVAQLLAELVARNVIQPKTAAGIAEQSPTKVARSLPSKSLIKAIRKRGLITSREAAALKDNEQLEELYLGEGTDGLPKGEKCDGVAYELASAAIRYGDFTEALIQVGRILPGLRDLPDLASYPAKGA